VWEWARTELRMVVEVAFLLPRRRGDYESIDENTSMA